MGVIAEFDIGRLGFPGRHDTLGGGHGDHVAVSLGIGVAFEAERCVFAFTVAFNAVVIEDWGDVVGVGNDFDISGFGLGFWGLVGGVYCCDS